MRRDPIPTVLPPGVDNTPENRYYYRNRATILAARARLSATRPKKSQREKMLKIWAKRSPEERSKIMAPAMLVSSRTYATPERLDHLERLANMRKQDLQTQEDIMDSLALADPDIRRGRGEVATKRNQEEQKRPPRVQTERSEIQEAFARLGTRQPERSFTLRRKEL